jgi:elongator complex protein 2
VPNIRVGSHAHLRYQLNCLSSIEAHPKSSISALGVSPSTNGVLDHHFLTGGSDGFIKLWRLEGGAVKEVQKMDLKGKLPLDLEVGYLPNSSSK